MMDPGYGAVYKDPGLIREKVSASKDIGHAEISGLIRYGINGGIKIKEENEEDKEGRKEEDGVRSSVYAASDWEKLRLMERTPKCRLLSLQILRIACESSAERNLFFLLQGSCGGNLRPVKPFPGALCDSM